MAIDGKVIVLTGGSSGIGEAAARRLAAAGATLCLVARREDELRRVQAAIETAGGRCHVYPANLADPDSLNACADRLLVEHPRLDVLVNNAARSIRRSIRESLDRVHDYERTMQLNYFGALRMTLRLLPRFLEQGEGQVINSSTMSAQIPIPLFPAYLASKSALDSFARSLAAEVGHRGIAVTTLYFPMVRTPMSSRTSIYRHMPMFSVEQAAGWIVRAVDERPARIGRPLGTLGELALAALPGPVTRHSQRFFRAMDRYLARRAGKPD
jgi:NAD(P)-dependent dehydrogenase (short-subunit alcohol dehydrogenase family)